MYENDWLLPLSHNDFFKRLLYLYKYHVDKDSDFSWQRNVRSTLVGIFCPRKEWGVRSKGWGVTWQQVSAQLQSPVSCLNYNKGVGRGAPAWRDCTMLRNVWRGCVFYSKWKCIITKSIFDFMKNSIIAKILPWENWQTTYTIHNTCINPI